MTTSPAPTDHSPGQLPSTAAPTATAPLRDLQRAGGIAALVEGTTYLAGMGVMLAYLDPRGFLDSPGDPAASLAFLLQHQTAMYLWYLLIYVVAGAALVVLTLGLHDRLKHAAPGLAQSATVFGLIWSGLVLASGMVALVGQRAAIDLAASDRAEAVSTWSSVSVVQDALGGGVEIVGALWVLMLSVAAVRTHVLSHGLIALGVLVGVAGTLTLVPGLETAGAVFGLGFIVWYVWVGHTLLRT